ncbi:putative RNA methyltransferase [Actinokineospora bangkokensis]|uniref:23S rRNA methyltransferase n=1 Tax=Actinokineospora bangkokensis TaxID=1193682 RepID=A0A1Q9LD78_9PSEU|nr:23S rRNA methyltransferase [Actinokineospora bangkokensis]OLR89964.1 23S rRNA methyltransferase [Actinokineospora bangkokensis]
MLAAAVPLLTCPHCGADLTLTDRTLRCPAHHSFDIARQGYVSLLRGAAPFTGDTPEMVAARVDFLGAGHYAPIASALTRVTPGEGCVVDLGAGTGYYLSTVLESLPDRVGLALDVSKHALRRAARAHPRVGAVVCDAWQPLPVRSGCAGLALNVFAPRNAPELHRVLGADGVLAVVAPTPRHLGELVGALGLLKVGEGKREGIDAKLAGLFEVVGEELVEFPMRLTAGEVGALVGMGPSAFHGVEVGAVGDEVAVTASVGVTVYRKAG